MSSTDVNTTTAVIDKAIKNQIINAVKMSTPICDGVTKIIADYTITVVDHSTFVSLENILYSTLPDCVGYWESTGT